MNRPASLPSRLPIEVVFDFVCPWCYLGVKRLTSLLSRRSDLDVSLTWRPFLLNPDMPRTGMSRADYMVRKFGAEDRVRRLYATISELGMAEGLNFDFTAIRRTPSSIDAHRLVQEAAKCGVADLLVMHIFAAHFIEGLDIGNLNVLTSLAAHSGMDPEAVAAFLNQSEGGELIYVENLRAHRLGINGVPCFIIGGEHAISGAQENEVLERLIDLAASTTSDY